MEKSNYMMTLVNRFRQTKSRLTKDTAGSELTFPEFGQSDQADETHERFGMHVVNSLSDSRYPCNQTDATGSELSFTEVGQSIQADETHERFGMHVVNSLSDSRYPCNQTDATGSELSFTEVGQSNQADETHERFGMDSVIDLLPPRMRGFIKKHQIEGLTFMLRNVIAGRGCILAHSMGLGKTMQVIALSDIYLRKTSKTILMLMPVNTIRHFLAEFDYWVPFQSDGNSVTRNFHVYNITDSDRSLKDRCKIVSEWSTDGGVLILGYEMFRSIVLPNLQRKRSINHDEQETIRHTIKSFIIASNLVVCDEGHRLKHMDTQISLAVKQLDTKLRVILTGYPLQNKLNEYFTLINYAVPNALGDEQEFKILFESPITMGQYSDSSPEEVQLMRFRAHVLQSLQAAYVHRRCEMILRDTLPKKFEYSLFFKMTSLQKELYKKVLEMNSKNPVNGFSIICKIMNDPNVLYDYLQDEEQTDIEDDESFNGKIYYEGLRSIMAAYTPKLIETSPKMIVLFQIIEYSLALNDKIIIFSQSLLTLNMIERGLEMKLKWKKNYQFYRIDGTTSQHSRQSMIQKFNQNSGSKVFLLSTRAACLGITLVGANRVVLLDASFNPSDDLQAVGRVYRYGQTKHTFIYKFVMDNSLEKAIFDHQIRKQQITKVVIDKQNPEPYMPLTNATSTYFQYENYVKTKEISSRSCDYYDSVLNNIVKDYSTLLTEEPLLHESLLIDKEEYKLSKTESLLAFTSYKAAKRSLTFDSTSHDNSSCSIDSDSQQSERTYSSREDSSSFSIDSDSQSSEQTIPGESSHRFGDTKDLSTSSDVSNIGNTNMDEESDSST